MFVLITSVKASGQEAGYVNPILAAQGDTMRFYLSAAENPVSVRIFRLSGGTRNLIVTIDSLKGGIQNVPDSAYYHGCNWHVTFTITVPAEWAPGVYVAEFPASSGTAGVLFAIRPAVRGSISSLAVCLNVNTWEAYNNFGGKSLYDFNSSSSQQSYKVSFLRPFSDPEGSGEYFTWEGKLVSWLDEEGTPYELTDNIDLFSDSTILDHYSVLILVGHDEYWTKQERSQIESFVRRGGRLMILGGNTCWWQARIEPSTQQLVCYRTASLDPLNGIADSIVTVNWFSGPVNDPENKITGVSYRNAGYVNNGNILPSNEGYGGYAAYATQNWIYTGTGLNDGDIFGYGPSIVGYETDGALFNWQDGTPTVSGQDSTPISFRILAISPAGSGEGAGGGHATMGVYYADGGGVVFNAATTDWVDGLLDPTVQRITMNVLSSFTRDRYPPDFVSWQPFRVFGDTIMHEYDFLNRRSLAIPPGGTMHFSVKAIDPRGQHVGYFWKVNGIRVGTDSSFDFTTPSGLGADSMSVITANSYNVNDTATLQWEIFPRALKIISHPADTLLYVRMPYYYKLDVSSFYNDGLSFNLISSPSGLSITSTGIMYGVPSDTGSFHVQVMVSDKHNNSDRQSFIIHVAARPDLIVVDDFDYTDSPLNHGWQIVTPYFPGTIQTVYDSVLGNRVLQISSPAGTGYEVERLGLWKGDSISVECKADSAFDLYVSCVDSSGRNVYFEYIPEDGHPSISSYYIIVPVGTNFGDGKWNFMSRDLNADMDSVRWGSHVSSILGFLVRGSIELDNLILGLQGRSDGSQRPVTLALLQNYPNPFNGSTVIKYTLGDFYNVRLVIYDVLGRKVKSLATNSLESPGEHEVLWDGTNNHGVMSASGVYFYALDAQPTKGGSRSVKVGKMVLMK